MKDFIPARGGDKGVPQRRRGEGAGKALGAPPPPSRAEGVEAEGVGAAVAGAAVAGWRRES